VTAARDRRTPRRGRRPKLRVVAPPRRRRLPFLLVALVVVGTLIGGVAGVQALVSQSSFHMQELSRRTEQLRERSLELRLKVAELSSPHHLQEAARRLGLQVPPEVNLLTVSARVQGTP
jgi:cell division protein FtsB